jgi:hypothetical protein
VYKTVQRGASSFVFFAYYKQIDQSEEDEMGVACSANVEKRNAYRLLVGKPEGKRPLGRITSRWVDNMKMGLGDIGWGDVDWIELAQELL